MEPARTARSTEEDRCPRYPEVIAHWKNSNAKRSGLAFRIGFSIDDLEETSFEGDHAFGMEKDEFQLDSIESSDDEDEDDDDDDDESQK